MTTPYRKKLIEVALPLKAINEASAREKSIRHGHPSTLHLWWARRPLAACRAVLFASLVDDPDSDPEFRRLGEEMAGKKRADLFNLIEELVQWENSNNPEILRSARAEIARCVASRLMEIGKLARDQVIADGLTALEFMARCHCRCINGGFDAKAGRVRYGFDTLNLPPAAVVDKFLADYAPPVLDPFCGGGSIPLEAQRLGLRAYASDLNPVPVLITKALIEIPPKFAGRLPVGGRASRSLEDKIGKAGETPALQSWHGAQGLAEDVRYYGQWMRDEAEKRIGHLYPKVKITKEMVFGSADVPSASTEQEGGQDGHTPRPDLEEYVGQKLTVIAWLWARTVKCPNPACGARAPLVRSFWVSTKRDRAFWAEPQLDRQSLTVRFHIRSDGQPPQHTTDRNGGRCLFCDRFIKKPELRDISVAYGLEEIPLAIVAEGKRGRVYLDGDVLPPVVIEKPAVPFLEQPITNDRRWFSPPLYGMPNFADLFAPRQLVALTTFSDLVQEARAKVLADAQRGAGVPPAFNLAHVWPNSSHLIGS